MSQKIRLWKILDERSIKEVPQTATKPERHLENWVNEDASIISDDLPPPHEVTSINDKNEIVINDSFIVIIKILFD